MKKLLLLISYLSLSTLPSLAQNPYLPMWEYIPDGEPYVFDDPDRPGHRRVYIYGSHDTMKTGYCGRELVTWSAPVDSLTRWRYDGVIFENRHDANGHLLRADGSGDVLYAPDVVETTDSSGRKVYYLYPNNQAGGRNGMVAMSHRPDGPFKVINWDKDRPTRTAGCLGFDPAVFVDDDGRVYGYWGFNHAYCAELDPQTMATVKPGTEVRADYISSNKEAGVFRFFEASSMRKIKDKYVLIYSRITDDGEFGLPSSNYTLAYAYSQHPLGPFTYGGTIIDCRGRDLDADGHPIFTATPNGNTHGSLCEIDGRWWVFFHRQTGTDEYSRQAMVAPINVTVTEGADGRVCISEAEYTSEGFMTGGLDPFSRYSAGIACYHTGPRPAVHHWPDKTFYGSYVAPRRLPDNADGIRNGIPQHDPYDLAFNHNPVVNNTHGSVVGYKYYDLSQTHGRPGLTLSLDLLPHGIGGSISVWIDSPHTAHGGRCLGTAPVDASWPEAMRTLDIAIPSLADYEGRHAIYLVISAATPGLSLCDLHSLIFKIGPAECDTDSRHDHRQLQK